MRSRRSRIVTIAGLTAFGVLVVVAGLSLRGPAREWWNISLLSSPDDAVRIAAIEQLMELRSVAAIPALMRSVDRDLRSLMDEPLAQFFEKARAESAKLELTEQSVAAVEKELRREMGMFPDERRALRGRLRGLRGELAHRYERTTRHWFRNYVSYRTMNRIARETFPAVLPKLFRWLESDDWHTRWIAAHLVIDLGLREAAPSLRALALDEDELVRHTAKAGLWMFGELDSRLRAAAAPAPSPAGRRGF